MPNSSAAYSILPATATINGRSQAQLGDQWWKTVYAIPAAQHFGLFDDRLDPRGRRGSVEKAPQGQFGKSPLFLVGGFGELTTQTDINDALGIQRTIVLPNNGQSVVFFPMLNANFDNLVNEVGNKDNITGDLTADELAEVAKQFYNTTEDGGLVSELFAEVDGTPVDNPTSYRQASEEPFAYTAPYPAEDGLLKPSGFTNETFLDNADAEPIQLKDLAIGKKVTIDPSVSQGYWLAVDFPGGAHKLKFGGTLSVDGEPVFSLNVNYDLLNPIGGGQSNDVLTGKSSNDYLDGSGGRDYLSGQKGNDLLIGGAGVDLLMGGKGSDEMWGDGGKDTFLYEKGDSKDTIFDLAKGEKIVCSGVMLPISVNNIMLDSGLAAAQIDFGSGDMLTLVGIKSSDLVVKAGVITLA
jgi:Ca2+-binding RTX toxin-like protein